MIPLDFATILFFVVAFFGIYTSLYFLITLIENWGHNITRLKKGNYPKVCIIVPCYNESKSVSKTLKSLLELDYPSKCLEIIVVDDGSTDDTFKCASQFTKFGVKVFKKKNGGKFTALNFAIEKTNAQFIGALDADSTVAKDSLNKLISRFYDTNKNDEMTLNKDIMAVTPSMIIDKPSGILRRIQSMEFIMGIMLRRVFSDIGSQHVTPGPFTIYRSDFFKKYGNYSHAHNTEDIEVALRIQTNNFIIENATDAYVYTHGPSTFKSLYKQRLRWYSGFIKNIFDYRHLFSPKHGNLGLFILPSSFISVFLLIIVIFYTLFSITKNVLVTAYNYWLIGFDLSQIFNFDIDSFFINTGPVAILGLFAIFFSLTIISFAVNFSSQKNIVWSYILFVLLYSWLFAYWWFIAALHCVFGKEIGWGHKSEDLKKNSNKNVIKWKENHLKRKNIS